MQLLRSRESSDVLNYAEITAEEDYSSDLWFLVLIIHVVSINILDF